MNKIRTVDEFVFWFLDSCAASAWERADLSDEQRRAVRGFLVRW